ncbi:MAG: hypothetical protein HN742_08935 [Lentisphaerae bacterium]|nr:hypothetical protein [Lentisphaerota bacterium]MBT4815875.1 hypothetical protein [Lentisphaerota bacterium]MBT5611150.1 hypothetical protein [Lentisphaerota bacterium]MBT7054726.1 hypothetical protein [Lentisphaerota bacterium]MBT7841984.1 hypothetical protein [Lentisphaerota bacterium]
MKRIAELAARLIDGDLNAADAEELDQLLARDREAGRELAELCRTEAALRGQQVGLDVAPRVMAAIRQCPELAGLYGAGGSVAVADTEAADRPRRRLVPVWLRVAAGVALFIGLGVSIYRQLFLPTAPVPKASAPVSVAHVLGEVALERAGVQLDATAGLALQRGDTVSVAPSAVATLTYADGTRLVLGAQTQVQLCPAKARRMPDAKRVELRAGVLTAHVAEQAAGQPLTIQTPMATATVLGTRLVLWAGPESTRLDVIEGKVGLSRSTGGAAVDVARGLFAVATPEQALISRPLPPRVRDGLQALYTFRKGTGSLIHDVSGAGPPLDLTIESGEAAAWIPGGGLRFEKPEAFAATARPASRIMEACRQTNELSIEAWVAPAAVDQIGPARIVTLSRDPAGRNFTLGQNGSFAAWPPPGGTFFMARLRSTDTGGNGMPALETSAGSVAADLAHVVYTRDRAGVTRLYVDGVSRTAGERTGDFSNWDSQYRLGLGDEFTHDRPWLGTFRLVAIYSRALPADDVLTNFRAGPHAN